MQQIEDNAIREIFFRKQIEAKITDAAVDARYDELKAKFDEEVKKTPPQREIDASHILVKTEDEAKADHRAARRAAPISLPSPRKSRSTPAPREWRRSRLVHPGRDGEGIRRCRLRHEEGRDQQGAGEVAVRLSTSSS